jgi:hypothetical protein
MTMAKPKVEIPIVFLEKLVQVLEDLIAATREITQECKTNNVMVKSDGWPTAAKGVQHIVEQLSKFAGPGNRVQKMSGEDILMPDQKLPQTKSKRVKKNAEHVATTKAARSAKTKPKRNDN